MDVIKTNIQDLVILKPRVFEDKRGYFFESFKNTRLEEHGLEYRFVQDNESKSVYGVVRGLHYQLSPFAQAKLLRVVYGKILDVAVDLRKNSPTFGKHYSIELSGDNKLQFLIPRGFAHGFSVLSKEAVVFYKCDNVYNKESERGIIFNDKTLDIDWNLKTENQIVSEKDLNMPVFEKAEHNF